MKANDYLKDLLKYQELNDGRIHYGYSTDEECLCGLEKDIGMTEQQLFFDIDKDLGYCHSCVVIMTRFKD